MNRVAALPLVVFASLSLGVFGYARYRTWKENATAESATGEPRLSPVSSDVIVSKAHFLRGNANSAWILVEFFDYECPACRRFAQSLKAGGTGIPSGVSYAIRHFPLPMHKLAVPAARLVTAAEASGRLAIAHDTLMSGKELTPQSIETTRAKLSIPAGRSEEVSEDGVVFRDSRLARAIGLDSTPTFILCARAGSAWVLEDPSQIAEVIARHSSAQAP